MVQKKNIKIIKYYFEKGKKYYFEKGKKEKKKKKKGGDKIEL